MAVEGSREKLHFPIPLVCPCTSEARALLKERQHSEVCRHQQMATVMVRALAASLSEEILWICGAFKSNFIILPIIL